MSKVAGIDTKKAFVYAMWGLVQEYECKQIDRLCMTQDEMDECKRQYEELHK